MNHETFLESFDYIADASAGVERLRKLILTLAVQGSLTESHEDSSSGASAQTSWDWRRARLEEVADVILGQSPPGATYNTSGEGSPFFQGKAEFTDRYAEIRQFTTAGVKFAKRDDILVSVRAPIGPTNLAPTDCAIGRGLAALRARAGVDQQYLHIAVRAIESELAAQGTGTTFKAITGQKLKAQEVALPSSLAEQQRIVQRVSELTNLCDELEQRQAARTKARSALTASTLNRIIETESVSELRAAARAFADEIGLHLAPGEGDVPALNSIRQTILDLAVRGRLTRQDSTDQPASALIGRIASERAKLVRVGGTRRSSPPANLASEGRDFEVPPGWVWCTLGELIVSNEAGWSPVCPAEPRSSLEQWGVLKLSALSWGEFRPHEHKVLAAGLTPRPAIEVRDGDFLMSRANTAALVGRSVVVTAPPPRLMMSDLVVRLGFVDRVTAEYVNILNGTRAVRALYAVVSKGTSDTMRKLSRDQILATPVPLPPLEEQGRIVRRVAELSALCDDLESQLAAARVLRGDIAASVLAHAVRGPATPRNGDDIPLVAAAGSLTR